MVKPLACAVLYAACASAAAGSDDVRVRARISPRCSLTVDVRRDDSAACWHLLCTARRPVKLGCDLTQMHQVVSLSVSPDRRRLAVISVGEGHPILELADLPMLLRRHRYSMLCTVNPFPGTLGMVGWNKDGVDVESDVPLNVADAEQRVALQSEALKRFRVSADNCAVERYDSDVR